MLPRFFAKQVIAQSKLLSMFSVFFSTMLFYACSNYDLTSTTSAYTKQRDDTFIRPSLKQMQKENRGELDRRNLDEYYDESGISRYFLSELPAWANSSVIVGCRRANTLRFLDYALMMKSYRMEYKALVEFQYLFNRDYLLKKSSLNSNYLLLKDEEQLFHDVSDKINSNLEIPFKMPAYKVVNIVWIDFLAAKLGDNNDLQRVLQNSELDSGPIVLLSMCMVGNEIQKIMVDNKLDDKGMQVIPFEMFSFFDREGKLKNDFYLDLNDFISEGQTVNFYTYNGSIPELNITGRFNIKKITLLHSKNIEISNTQIKNTQKQGE